MSLKESLEDPVSKYMISDFAEVGPGDSIVKAAKTMQSLGSTEALVSTESGPLGIITERDILYKVVAAGQDPSKVVVQSAMSSPVSTIDADSKVRDAIARMAKLGVRRLAVTRNGKLVGLVTQKAVVSGTLDSSIGLPELAKPGELRCPYCDATMKDRTELSRHIDQVHVGLGLLEGDKSKW